MKVYDLSKRLTMFSWLVMVSFQVMLTPQVNAQQRSDTNDWIAEITSRITPYGSIRLGAGFAEGGEIGISNNSPRLGLRFKHRLSKDEAENFYVIGRLEMGLNLTSRDDTVAFSIDGEEGIAQLGNAIFTRIGYAGLSYREFTLVFGKNNSVYYTMAASKLDDFLAFGGTGLGVWNVSDGGISGTGRANRVIQLDYKNAGVQLGAQIQARNITDENQSIDSYGFGASYTWGYFGLGVGYNKVNDGVIDPEPNQPKAGDEAFIVAGAYQAERFKFALSYGVFTAHHKTGDVYYDSKGIECYARYKFSTNKRWHVASGFSYIAPDSGQELGDLITQFGILEVAYNFKKSSYVFISSKQEFSKGISGVHIGEDIYGFGIRFDF